MKITVLGAGAWGTALAARTAPQHDTLLWARDARAAQALRDERRNRHYLPEIELDARLAITSDWDEALAHGGLVIVATPMAGLAPTLARLPADVQVLWLCKGFEAGSGRLGHEIARELLPQAQVGVLSGPSFALEVARGQPTALVAASEHDELAALAVQALHGQGLRVYTSSDPAGVEVGGALKNVMAIATGMCDGLALGLNARAALITRGLAEITRLGLALGARADTFMGLSGLGDLVLTCTGDLSRNRQVGQRLARGERLPDILAALGHVAEGVPTTATALERAGRLGVDLPICAAVDAVLQGRASPLEAAVQLMGRDARAEAQFG